MGFARRGNGVSPTVDFGPFWPSLAIYWWEFLSAYLMPFQILFIHSRTHQSLHHNSVYCCANAEAIERFTISQPVYIDLIMMSFPPLQMTSCLGCNFTLAYSTQPLPLHYYRLRARRWQVWRLFPSLSFLPWVTFWLTVSRRDRQGATLNLAGTVRFELTSCSFGDCCFAVKLRPYMAGDGLEPSTFWLWARRATDCTTPQ